ncbi:MAG: hypothetical protein JST00_18595 [Deltaproteobacteria bacterium]|nr:hypothetical protein [Deltaproteobacteria bacterium]
MRKTARVVSVAVCIVASWARLASAQEPATPPPSDPTSPAAPPPDAPAADLPPTAPPPADPNAAPPPSSAPPTMPLTEPGDVAQRSEEAPLETTRGEGLRLGLDFGFTRAVSADPGRFSEGTPSILPLGIDIGARTSPTFLVGGHAYAGLASRNDCLSLDSCRARAYGFGPHIEVAFSKNPKASLIGWFRYGMTFEIGYQGGRVNDPTGYTYRQAIDFMDARIGADFIASRGSAGKTTRIGGYLGMTAGVMTGQSGISNTPTASGVTRNLSRDSGDPHVYLSVGLRATLDP